MQRSLPVVTRRTAPTHYTRCNRGRKHVCCVQARRSSSDPSPEILTAFFYGRALAITINKRLGEAVIDLVSDVSKALAERPQRLAELQEEVSALARKEMSSSGFLPELTSAGAASGASSGRGAAKAGGGAGAGAAGPADPQAAIDDLRSEIAYARASLNGIREKQRAAAAQN